jgi:hypothetical protein
MPSTYFFDSELASAAIQDANRPLWMTSVSLEIVEKVRGWVALR